MPMIPSDAAIAIRSGPFGISSKGVLRLEAKSAKRRIDVGKSAKCASILEQVGLHDVGGIKGIGHMRKGAVTW